MTGKFCKIFQYYCSFSTLFQYFATLLRLLGFCNSLNPLCNSVGIVLLILPVRM